MGVIGLMLPGDASAQSLRGGAALTGGRAMNRIRPPISIFLTMEEHLMKQHYSHNHKTAFVTGASSGIGLEFSRFLAADGYDLVLSARSLDSLNRLADQLRADYGVRIGVISKDLSQPPAPQD
jgi:NADPH:quinone reductase-like Zn-dependent oxidoreductase